MTTAPTRTALLYMQELKDGSWLGNAAWAGRTFSEGASDPELVIRRLVARLGAIPSAGPPNTVKLTRVPLSGAREEHERDLATLLQ